MLDKIPAPINTNDKYFHGINMRLEVLIDQFSSLLNHIAEKEGVATTSNTVEQTYVEPVAEVKVDKPVRKPRPKKE